jgi:hypothetical protein
MTDDRPQTVDKLRPKWRAEVVQLQFKVFLLLQRDIWVGRFRKHFLHEYLKTLWWAYLRYCVIGVSAYMSGITVFLTRPVFIGAGILPQFRISITRAKQVWISKNHGQSCFKCL